MPFNKSHITLTLMAICLLATNQVGFSQTAQWDSTFRPASYDVKVAQFQSYPNSSKDIVFLGNSITANTDWTELLGIPHLKNRGISGDITFGILERLHEVIEGQPRKVFILIGVNDISRNIPDSLILDNYQKMISRIKAGSPSTQIYFHTMLPTNNTFEKFKNHYNKEQHILALNKALKELSLKEKITLIDLYPEFLDSSQRLDEKYTIDGLHLSVAGYSKWKEILEKGNYLK